MLDEVEKVCTHVAVLRNGKLMADGPVESILTTQDQVVISSPDMDQTIAALAQIPLAEVLRQEKGKAYLTLHEGLSSTDLNQALFNQGIVLSELHVRKKSLESQFLQIIKNN